MSRLKKNLPTICIVTCYRQPDYLRAATLRQGVKDSGVFSEVTIIKNASTDARRYIEVFAQLLKVRFTKNPDVYLITFRGYELLPLVLLIGAGKKIIYDELINPVEWFVYEHTYFTGLFAFMGYLLKFLFRIMMRMTTVIIADTDSHADYSSHLMSIKRDKYCVIPVGADETLLHPRVLSRRRQKPFRVLYYGSMVPLHGISYVIDAAVKLADQSNIEFHIVGGKKQIQRAVEEATSHGAHIRYDAWIEYKKLPELFAASDLALGGPFGGTVQSQFVITGKTYQFLASTMPVVVGYNDETRLFTDRKNALVVAQADSDALAQAIRWAYDHPKQLRLIAQNGRQLYDKEFSSAIIADDLRRLFTTKHIL